MLEKLKDSGNVNGVILPGIKEGKWKVRNVQMKLTCTNQGRRKMKITRLNTTSLVV